MHQLLLDTVQDPAETSKSYKDSIPALNKDMERRNLKVLADHEISQCQSEYTDYNATRMATINVIKKAVVESWADKGVIGGKQDSKDEGKALKKGNGKEQGQEHEQGQEQGPGRGLAEPILAELVAKRDLLMRESDEYWQDLEVRSEETEKTRRMELFNRAVETRFAVHAALYAERGYLVATEDEFSLTAMHQAAVAVQCAAETLSDIRTQTAAHVLAVVDANITNEQSRENLYTETLKEHLDINLPRDSPRSTDDPDAPSKLLTEILAAITNAAAVCGQGEFAVISLERELKHAEEQAFDSAWTFQLAHAQAVADFTVKRSLYLDRHKAVQHSFANAKRMAQTLLTKQMGSQDDASPAKLRQDSKSAEMEVSSTMQEEEANAKATKSRFTKATKALRALKRSITENEKLALQSMRNMGQIGKQLENLEADKSEHAEWATNCNVQAELCRQELESLAQGPEEQLDESRKALAKSIQVAGEADAIAAVSKAALDRALAEKVIAADTAKAAQNKINALKYEAVEAEAELSDAKKDNDVAYKRFQMTEALHKIKHVNLSIRSKHGFDQMPRFRGVLEKVAALEVRLLSLQEAWLAAMDEADVDALEQTEDLVDDVCSEIEDLRDVTLATVEDVQGARTRSVLQRLKSQKAENAAADAEAADAAADGRSGQVGGLSSPIQKKSSQKESFTSGTPKLSPGSPRSPGDPNLPKSRMMSLALRRSSRQLMANQSAAVIAHHESPTAKSSSRPVKRKKKRTKKKKTQATSAGSSMLHERLAALKRAKEEQSGKIHSLNADIGKLKAESALIGDVPDDTTNEERAFLKQMASVRRENALIIEHLVAREATLANLLEGKELLAHRKVTTKAVVEGRTHNDNLKTKKESIEHDASDLIRLSKEGDEQRAIQEGHQMNVLRLTTEFTVAGGLRKKAVAKKKALGQQHTYLLKQRWRVSEKIQALTANLRIGNDLKKQYVTRAKLEDEVNRLELRMSKKRADRQRAIAAGVAEASGRQMTQAENKIARSIRTIAKQLQWWGRRWDQAFVQPEKDRQVAAVAAIAAVAAVAAASTGGGKDDVASKAFARRAAARTRGVLAAAERFKQSLIAAGPGSGQAPVGGAGLARAANISAEAVTFVGLTGEAATVSASSAAPGTPLAVPGMGGRGSSTVRESVSRGRDGLPRTGSFQRPHVVVSAGASPVGGRSESTDRIHLHTRTNSTFTVKSNHSGDPSKALMLGFSAKTSPESGVLAAVPRLLTRPASFIDRCSAEKLSNKSASTRAGGESPQGTKRAFAPQRRVRGIPTRSPNGANSPSRRERSKRPGSQGQGVVGW
jgi:hypothetical protein